ncbi:MAG: 16S rRNA (uracil(1498)-N(3))-methyltransferase [Oscillospiraceae bacterium]|jgi:16S rRNA (uracil1498-N3)-methyltransferase|nr:16S rRNA (uracil(1498)-N(3))-methyltransferase [Oscillospiraceae bacterium]
MPRFFVDSPLAVGGDITLTGEVAAHIRALRLRDGEEFTLCDGAGWDYNCRVTASARGKEPPIALVVAKTPSLGEPRVACAVYIALAKGDKLDYAVQKCVELGATSFTLFQSERCVARPSREALAARVTRLQAISRSAAEQSRRGKIPPVTFAETYEDAIRQAATAELPLFFYEGEQNLHLRDALREDFKSVSIVTGSEGGFTPEEAATATRLGLRSISLGARILRCDTAPVAGVAAVMLTKGD